MSRLGLGLGFSSLRKGSGVVWGPEQTPNLVGWWRAADAANALGFVTSWTPTAGVADAALVLAATASDRRPVYAAVDTDMNSLPAAQFNNVAGTNLVSGVLASNLTAYTFYFVFRCNTATSNGTGRLISWDSDAFFVDYTKATTVNRAYKSNDDNVTVTHDSTTATVLVASYSAARLRMYVNSLTVGATDNTVAAPPTIDNFTIADADPAPVGQYFGGSIGDIIITSAEDDALTRGKNINYLAAKYGVTLT